MIDDRQCPICGAADSRSVAHQAFEALVGSLVNGYDVVCCRACGFGYASGLPGPDDFASYYAGMSRYENPTTSYHTSMEDQARCESIVDTVDLLVANRSLAILDIGCSTGALLAAFKRRGFTDLEGLDPSPACTLVARREHDIDVRTGTAADVANLPRRYGLVILSHILEHLLDPLQALRDVRKVLDADGLLLVELPDVEGFAASARVAYQEFSVEHVNYFSGVSLGMVAGIAGLEAVEMQQHQVPWLSGGSAPVVRAVFRKGVSSRQPTKDDVTEAALLSYVATSERIEVKVRARIRELVDHGRPVLVWGVGTHTRHLLKSGAMDGLKIAAWVDSDPKYEGTEMRGVPVLGPEAVKLRGETILVSSGTMHHEIARQIHEDLRVSNEIVLLYD